MAEEDETVSLDPYRHLNAFMTDVFRPLEGDDPLLDVCVTRAALHLGTRQEAKDCVPILLPLFQFFHRVMSAPGWVVLKEGLNLDQGEELFLAQLETLAAASITDHQVLRFIMRLYTSCRSVSAFRPLDQVSHIALSTMIKICDAHRRLDTPPQES